MHWSYAPSDSERGCSDGPGVSLNLAPCSDGLVLMVTPLQSIHVPAELVPELVAMIIDLARLDRLAVFDAVNRLRLTSGSVDAA